MVRLEPTTPAMLTLGLSALASVYFFGRFLIRRNVVSLALVFMANGWSVCALIVSGYIPKEQYDTVSYLGLVISMFLLTSLFMIEFWEDYRKTIRKRDEIEALDKLLKGKKK